MRMEHSSLNSQSVTTGSQPAERGHATSAWAVTQGLDAAANTTLAWLLLTSRAVCGELLSMATKINPQTRALAANRLFKISVSNFMIVSPSKEP